MDLSVFKTKTAWMGVLMIGGGVVEIAFDKNWSSGSEKILIGLGMIFGRLAISKAINGAA